MNRLRPLITRQPTTTHRFVQISAKAISHAGVFAEKASVPTASSAIKVTTADAAEPLNSSKQSQQIYLRKLLLLLDSKEDGDKSVPDHYIDRKSVLESLLLLKDPNLVSLMFSFIRCCHDENRMDRHY